MSVSFANAHGTSNGTSDVTVVPAPSAGVTHLTRSLTFFNSNATARTITLKLDDGTNERIIAKKTLSQDKSWLFTPILVLDDTVEGLEMVLDGGTTDVQWTAHYSSVS